MQLPADPDHSEDPYGLHRLFERLSPAWHLQISERLTDEERLTRAVTRLARAIWRCSSTNSRSSTERRTYRQRQVLRVRRPGARDSPSFCRSCRRQWALRKAAV